MLDSFFDVQSWEIEQCRLREMIDTKDYFSNIDEISLVGGVDISFVIQLAPVLLA